ncbi:MAG: MarR family winged helix-turn-helix transcriptional regulator [Mycobacteriales bacterium]
MTWFSTHSRDRFRDMIDDRFGLTPPEFGAMALIASQPGVSQSALGQRSGRDPSTMVAVIDQLERLGYAERDVDPADRRRRTIMLTKRGQQVYREAAKATDEVSDELLGALDTRERDELNRLLRKLCGLPDIGTGTASTKKPSPGRSGAT